MKKIINGKLYNTETAQEIIWCDYGYQIDLSYCKETLYRKKTGEFFLYGSGRAGSSYAEWLPGYNCWTSGEKIRPLTEEEAMKWVEQNCTADEYMEIFGDVEE